MTAIDCRTKSGELLSLVDMMQLSARFITRNRCNEHEFHEALKDLCADREFQELIAYCYLRGYMKRRKQIDVSGHSFGDDMELSE